MVGRIISEFGRRRQICSSAPLAIKAGRLRAVAVLGGKRSPLLPEVATVGETVPGYEFTNWFGMTVPAATPRDLINRLYADVSKVLQQPDFRDRIAGMGADVIGSTPDQFGAFMNQVQVSVIISSAWLPRPAGASARDARGSGPQALAR